MVIHFSPNITVQGGGDAKGAVMEAAQLSLVELSAELPADGSATAEEQLMYAVLGDVEFELITYLTVWKRSSASRLC